MTMSESSELEAAARSSFLKELRHHLSGWAAKIEEDFSERSYERELSELDGDLVYKSFGFATPEYVLVRLMGRVSISIGRRLGEIYDKVLRELLQTKYNLLPEEVSPILSGLRLDLCIKLEDISSENQARVARLVAEYLPGTDLQSGLGMEVRYNFNPNDSARLRKDVAMAEYVRDEGLLPVYLVFASISPRAEAIARLRRAGWNFIIGEPSIQFINELTGINILAILNEPEIRKEVDDSLARLMKAVLSSHVYQEALRRNQQNDV
jgi:hypothetical protein